MDKNDKSDKTALMALEAKHFVTFVTKPYVMVQKHPSWGLRARLRVVA